MALWLAEHTPPRICYHATFGRYTSKGVGKRYQRTSRVHQKLQRAGVPSLRMGLADPLENAPPHVGYDNESDRC